MLLLMLSGNVQTNPVRTFSLRFQNQNRPWFYAFKSIVPKMIMIKIRADTTNTDIMVISKTWIMKLVTDT